MLHLRSIGATILVAALAAACGGTPGVATDGPGGGGSPTQAPGASQPGGGGGAGAGGGGGGGGNQIHIEVSAPVQAVADLPFLASLSQFGGSATQFNFGDPSREFAGVQIVGGDWVFSYASAAFTASAQDCELTNWNIGETSASGTFDCANGSARNTADSSASIVRIKGTFEVSK